MNPNTHSNLFSANAWASISSLEKKPDSGGIPAMAIVATSMVTYVMGRCFFKPPMLRISCSSLMAWITDPAPKNNNDLKHEWVMTWNKTHENEPTHNHKNKKTQKSEEEDKSVEKQ